MKKKILIIILLLAIFVSNVSAIIQSDEIQPINQNSLIQNRILNVVMYQFNGNYNSAVQSGLEQFQAGSMSSENGKYKIVGQKYVSIKNNMSKFTRLIFEQGELDKKTLTTGETWNMGGGWTLTVEAIDARTNPRQVWFTLSKNGTKKDDKKLAQGQIYTYVERIFAGESDVPLFVTYVDSIFAGATSDMVQIKYTWALDTKPIIIKR